MSAPPAPPPVRLWPAQPPDALLLSQLHEAQKRVEVVDAENVLLRKQLWPAISEALLPALLGEMISETASMFGPPQVALDGVVAPMKQEFIQSRRDVKKYLQTLGRNAVEQFSVRSHVGGGV